MAGEWVVNLREEWKSSTPDELSTSWRKLCIYKVPKYMRDLNKEAYTPGLASFGPYHHDSEHLKPMESHKRRLLHRFLRKAEDKLLEDLIETMRKEVDDLMKCYEGLDRQYWKDGDRFLQMMILDGSFMLETLFHIRNPYQATHRRDPIINNSVVKKLYSDMLLLENQLPLRVLDIMLNFVGNENIGIESATSFLLDVINQDSVINHKEEALEYILNANTEAVHFLAINRVCMVTKGDFIFNSQISIRSATELVESGVKLETSASNCCIDISFANGVLRIPPVKVDGHIGSLLLNFVAYEQLHNKKDGIVSYILFMERLINTDKDVTLLRKKKIITGWLGSDAAVADLFNRLPKYVAFQDRFDGDDVMEALSIYCLLWWSRMRYACYHWIFYSVIGALIVLALTILQTEYTILGYYYRK